VLADTRRKLAIRDLNPGAVVMAGTMPAVSIVQIVIIGTEDNVIGCVDTHIKPQPGW
jgi:hypothetical protein